MFLVYKTSSTTIESTSSGSFSTISSDTLSWAPSATFGADECDDLAISDDFCEDLQGLPSNITSSGGSDDPTGG